MNLTPTQAALLQRGLDHLISNPGHILESDLRRVIWCLAQCAVRNIAEEGTASGTLDLAAMQTASDMADQVHPPADYIGLVAASKRYGVPLPTLRYHARKGSFEARKPDKRTWMAEAHSLAVWVSERSE